AQIAENQGTVAGADLRHVVASDDGPTQQGVRLPLRQAGLPQIAALVVLKLAQSQDRAVVGQPRRPPPVGPPQRVVKVENLICGDGRRRSRRVANLRVEDDAARLAGTVAGNERLLL